MSSKLSRLKLIILDVDGTLTDGSVYIDNHGVESKKFNVRDGAGILIAQYAGIEFMILTSRESFCVAKRAAELKIADVHQGVINKADFFRAYMQTSRFAIDEIAYIGDDINDLEIMQMVGFSACPCDACEEIRQSADMVLAKNGGDGVVRSFVELLLKDRGQWTDSFGGVLGDKDSIKEY